MSLPPKQKLSEESNKHQNKSNISSINTTPDLNRPKAGNPLLLPDSLIREDIEEIFNTSIEYKYFRDGNARDSTYCDKMDDLMNIDNNCQIINIYEITNKNALIKIYKNLQELCEEVKNRIDSLSDSEGQKS
jgi:hypothetical protein